MDFTIKENQDLFYSKCVFINVLNNNKIDDLYIDFKNKKITTYENNCYIYMPFEGFYIYALGNDNIIVVKFSTAINVGMSAIIKGENDIMIHADYDLHAKIKGKTIIYAGNNANIECCGNSDLYLDNNANVKIYGNNNNVYTKEYSSVISGKNSNVITGEMSTVNVSEDSNIIIDGHSYVLAYPNTTITTKNKCMVIKKDTNDSILTNTDITHSIKLNNWLQPGFK
jgi:deoxycytidine triphosphate deaminase